MKRVVRSLLVAGGVLFATQSAFAIGECDKYNNSGYDKTYCFAKLFVESDKELNAVYKDLRGVIKEPAKTNLLKVQRDWMTHRDRTCQPEPGTINVDCNYDENRKRTDYLRDRLRECKTGTCRDDMIGSKSWN